MNHSMTFAQVAAMCTFVAAVAATAVALQASAQTPASTPAQPITSPATAPVADIDQALHQDLGGTAGIAALMNDFVVRLKADARIGR